MATPPTFVASYGNTAWSSATQTASVTVQANDLIVVAAGTLDSSPTVNTPSGGGLTFTLQQAVTGQTQQSNTYLWTAQSPSAQTFTLTMSASDKFAWFAEVWRNHNGVGASAKTTATSTTSLSLTTRGADSALVMVDNDWNGRDGTSRTYLTSVGAFTEEAYQLYSGYGTFYGGHYADSGAVWSKTVGMSAPSGQRPSLLVLEVLAAPPAQTGSLSITATALSSNKPPAMRIDINDTRSPGQASSLTVMRNNPDGTQTVVRTSDGNPLQLSAGIGLLYDYEMALGSPVSYTTLENPGVTSLQATVTASRPWLIHPGQPGLSMQINAFAPNPSPRRTRPVVRGVFNVMGRVNPVVVTDGVRHGRMLTLTLYLQSAAERAAFDALTNDAATLLLNVPPSLGYNVPTAYIAIGDIEFLPVIDKVYEQMFTATMPYYEVDRPVGGTQSTRTYASVAGEFGSYLAARSAYSSYAAATAGP